VRYLEEDVAALAVTLMPEDLRRLEEVFPYGAAAGTRYPEPMMALLDSKRKAS